MEVGRVTRPGRAAHDIERDLSAGGTGLSTFNDLARSKRRQICLYSVA